MAIAIYIVAVYKENCSVRLLSHLTKINTITAGIVSAASSPFGLQLIFLKNAVSINMIHRATLYFNLALSKGLASQNKC